MQCSANPLYDTGCQGYEEAYFTQQCTANPLYDTECDGYDTAYYNAQCTASPLYDSGCEGHLKRSVRRIHCMIFVAQAMNKHTLINSVHLTQYDEQCPVMLEPLVETS